MTLTAPRRLPGVSFETAPGPLDESLPRMDVAGFVGIAASGPLHVPVVVEDIERFTDVFGQEPVLARDARGDDHRAYLAGAVEAFFANGGVRAWVVRAGDEAQAATNELVLPGVVAPPRADGSAGWRLAAVAARSPGSWSDGLRAGVVLHVEAGPPLAVGAETVTLGLAAVVAAGDVLRLDYGDGLAAFVVASRVDDTRDGRVVRWDQSWWVDAQPDLTAIDPGSVTKLTTGDPEAIAVLDVDPGGPGSPPDEVLPASVTVEAATALGPGDVLLSSGADGAADVLLLVGDEADSPPGSLAEATRTFELGGAWSIGADEPAALGSAPQPIVEVLRLEVLAWRAEQLVASLGGLGLAAGHDRFVGDLPSDVDLFARAAGLPRYAGGSARAAVEDFARRDLPSLWRAADSPRFPFAGGPGGNPVLLPLAASTATDPLAAGPRPAQADPDTRLERDGVAEFGAGLFVDGDLAGLGIDTLLAGAFEKSYLAERPARLRGIHALVPIDEVTLLAVPDAVHPGWDRFEPPPPVVLTAPELAAPDVSASGARLSWTAVADATGYELEEALDAEFTVAPRCVATAATTAVKDEFPYCPATYHFRVRATRDLDRGPWSNTVTAHLPAAAFMPCPEGALAPEAAAPTEAAVTELPPPTRIEWRLRTGGDDAPSELVALHTAVLRLCAARGDVLGLLSLPAGYHPDDALAYTGLLAQGVPEFDDAGQPVAASLLPAGVQPLGTGEARALTYGAVYHPWLVTGLPGRLRTRPPVGAVAGTYASRALTRGAWVAPANQPLEGVIALDPSPGDPDRLRLLQRSVNTFDRDPRGFFAVSQLTLSTDDALAPVNVRRLLILLRRLVQREGDTYVFQPHDGGFRRLVRMRFERILTGLFRRGAFAGTLPADGFSVVVDESVNPPASVEQGRFVVELAVAPSLPATFIRVRLVMSGGGELSVGEV